MENQNQNATSFDSKVAKGYQPNVKHVHGLTKGLIIAILGVAVGLFFVLKDFDFDGGSRYSGQLRNMESTQLSSGSKAQNSNLPSQPFENLNSTTPVLDFTGSSEPITDSPSQIEVPPVPENPTTDNTTTTVIDTTETTDSEDNGVLRVTR